MNMSKTAKFILPIAFLALTVSFYGCATTKSTEPAVFPVPELPVGLTLAVKVNEPALIETLKEAGPGLRGGHNLDKTITQTIEDVTVGIEYWSPYMLNRTFNRGNTVSPFYYEEAWHQGDKTDAFYLTVTNNRDKPIYFKAEACSMKDDREYFYTGLSYDDLVSKIKYKLGRDIRVNNGLEKAKEILLATQLMKGEIKSKQTVKGFVPFTKITRTAAKVFVTILIEKSPETEIGRYQKLEFLFPFVQDALILARQPAVQRY